MASSTAIGFGTYFVMQSGSSSLLRLRDQILRGLAHAGPALFSIYSGATGTGIPPFLAAAAAAESRAFPALSYDPSAGADWATNPVTQIRWGLGYIQDRYGSPCGAWAHSQARGFY